MNKKLLTVAIGAALGAAPMFAAQADVKLFGRAQSEVGQLTNDGANTLTPPNNASGVSAQTTETMMNDAAQGRFGILVDEDLGGGLTAIASYEFITDTADGYAIGSSTATTTDSFGETVTYTNRAQSLNSRHFYVGLSHKAIGTLKLGRMDGAYKQTGAKLDPYIATNLEARNNYGMSGNADGYGILNAHGGYLSNMMQYISPKMVGLQLDVAIGVDGTGTDGNCRIGNATSVQVTAPARIGDGCGQGDNTRGDISAALTWAGGPASVFLAYNKASNVNAVAGLKVEPTSKKIGGSIKLGKGVTHTVNLQFEKTDRDQASTATWGSEGQYFFLGYHLGIGAVTVSLQGGKFEDNVNTEGTYYMIAGKYNFSKTASAFVGYRHTELENNLLAAATIAGNTVTMIRDENYMGVGLRKDF